MTIEPIVSTGDIVFADSCDVLVIGLGAAGASAAIDARRAGADVLVLERASAGGGSTQYSGGFIYLGGGTRVQKKNGFDDTVEDMYNYLVANTPKPDLQKIRDYSDGSLAHFEWLETQGIRFNDQFYPHKHVEHSSEEGLAWTGNEKAWPYREKARAMPRGHKVTKPGGQQELGQGGFLLIDTLTKKAKDLGVRIVTDAKVGQLVVDKAGRVIGAKYRQFGEERFVGARRGVVIATGGFLENPELIQKYQPLLADERIGHIGAPTADGSGIILGQSVGAALENMTGNLITAPFYPPESLLKGILVNKFGQRFVEEDSYHGKTSTLILQQPDGIAYLIVDNEIFSENERPFGGQELVDAWENYADMEKDLKLPAGSLQATIAEYNRNAAAGKDPEFHKYKDYIQPLTHAPFAAIDCSFGKARYGAFTLGGLKTSAKAEVLREDGMPIPALFAAGACAANIAQDGTGYSSGTCLGESTFFGRRAGATAASLPPTPEVK